MNRQLAPVEFANDSGFNIEPKYFTPSPGLRRKFAELQDELLARELDEAQTVSVHRRLKQAANEAAGLAWTTNYPLLVFPTLFTEIAQQERLNETRQLRIRARSEMLLEHAV